MKPSTRYLSSLLLFLTLAPAAYASSFSLRVDSLNRNAGVVVTVPVRLQQSDAAAGALAFVVSYDASRLSLLPSGQPAARLAPGVPASFQISSYATIEGDLGRVGILIFDPNLPIATIPSGIVTNLDFAIPPTADGFAAVKIDALTPPSASDAQGNAILYSGRVDGGVTITPNRPTLSVEPGVIGFGSVPVGSPSERIFVIANSGNAPLTLSRIRIGNGNGSPFRLSPIALPLVLDPGASLSLTVSFLSSTPGTFSSLVEIEGGSSLEIPISASSTEGQSFSYSERFLLPAAARVPGANGSQWRTRVTMFNRDRFPVGARLRYVAPEGKTEATSEFVLAPGETRRFEDVASALGLELAKGAIEIELSSPEIVLTSSTYNINPQGGQFSEAVPLVDWKRLFHGGRRVALIGLDRSPARRTAVTLMNLSAKSAVLTVELREQDGTSRGTRDYLLQPGQIRSNIDIFDLLGGREASALTLEISTGATDATFYAFASTVDNQTGAPLYVEAQ